MADALLSGLLYLKLVAATVRHTVTEVRCCARRSDRLDIGIPQRQTPIGAWHSPAVFHIDRSIVIAFAVGQ
jgi:hypothetical protein